MPAPKGNKNAVGNPGGGAPSSYKPEYSKIARKACAAGFTDQELADLFEVNVRTIANWKNAHVDFLSALKVSKAVADERVERSLFARATGYEHDEVDIRVIDHELVKTEIRKYYPPDTTAAIFWLKNRRPSDWREVKAVELTGKDGAPVETITRIELVALDDGAN